MKVEARSRLPKRVQMAVGKRIRELRLKKGLSQQQLAQACNLCRDRIGEIERGNNNIRLSSLLIITRQLGVTVEKMFRGII